MLASRGNAVRASQYVSRRWPSRLQRALHQDGRTRLSNFWTPTAISETPKIQRSTHDRLIQAGFLRQAHAGIFHLLPLGLRVQDKIERLLDKHMTSLGASKVSLSSLSSQSLWAQSGRLEGRDSEFWRLDDRKGAKFLLSPTHEEEITTVVAQMVNSHKALPVRLYQISRKYRDEARPRQGLLRGREFVMKDLYTFDATEQQAISTYAEVRQAYCAFLDELNLSYLVADADSGNMGGNLSHEYHFVSPSGEDKVITCSSCGFTINEELYVAPSQDIATDLDVEEYVLVSKDRKHLFKVVVPKNSGGLNLHIVKRIVPDADLSVQDAMSAWRQTAIASSLPSFVTLADPRCSVATDIAPRIDEQAVILTTPRDNDPCPKCSKRSLTVTQAVEIGHTFHLSTRYSEPLGAIFTTEDNRKAPMQMGCHGIGVSRLIAAVAGLLADDKGLNWPLAVAPFGAALIAVKTVTPVEVATVYDEIKESLPALDVVIDDREHRAFGWKLNDADLIGYPFVIVVGRKWASDRTVELQCRRRGIRQDVPLEALPTLLSELAATL